jgi:hypothetical protein
MDSRGNGFRKRLLLRAYSTPAKQQRAGSMFALLKLPQRFRNLIQAALGGGALQVRKNHHELVFGGPATKIVFSQQTRHTSGDRLQYAFIVRGTAVCSRQVNQHNQASEWLVHSEKHFERPLVKHAGWNQMLVGRDGSDIDNNSLPDLRPSHYARSRGLRRRFRLVPQEVVHFNRLCRAACHYRASSLPVRHDIMALDSSCLAFRKSSPTATPAAVRTP